MEKVRSYESIKERERDGQMGMGDKDMKERETHTHESHDPKVEKKMESTHFTALLDFLIFGF